LAYPLEQRTKKVQALQGFIENNGDVRIGLAATRG
jgi:hypothetical protein